MSKSIGFSFSSDRSGLTKDEFVEEARKVGTTVAFLPSSPLKGRGNKDSYDTFGMLMIEDEAQAATIRAKLKEAVKKCISFSDETQEKAATQGGSDSAKSSPGSPKPAPKPKLGAGGFFDDSKVSIAAEISQRREQPARAHEEKAEPPQEWRIEQTRLAGLVKLDDALAGFAMPWADDEEGGSDRRDEKKLPKLTRIGGVDISFVKDTNIAVASLIVIDYESKDVIYESMMHCTMNLPYVAGYLAFREVGPLIQLVDKVKKEAPTKVPQIIFVDGNGLLHPRRCGLACHLGVIVDIPTVGCAKNMLAVDGLSRESVEESMFGKEGAVTKVLAAVPAPKSASARKPVSPAKNFLYPLVGRSGELWGHAALTGNSTKNPIYISAGHRISMASASRLAILLALQRVVEPIRQADLRSRKYIKDNLTGKEDEG